MDRASGGGGAAARGGGGDGLDWRMWERSSLAVGKTREACDACSMCATVGGVDSGDDGDQCFYGGGGKRLDGLRGTAGNDDGAVQGRRSFHKNQIKKLLTLGDDDEAARSTSA